MPKHYLIRADASPAIGSGHVMRMIALGQMLQDEGCSVHFATIVESQDLVRRITAEGFLIHHINQNGEWDCSRDAEQLVKLAKEIGVNWVILDGYHFITPYQEIVKRHGLKLMCMDDVAQCHFLADLIVNQNINAAADMYSAERYTQFMVGPRNAMLRREYIQARSRFQRKSTKKIENILVAMGGVDLSNVTRKVCEVLDTFDNHRMNIKAIMGPLNPHYEDILSYSKISKNRIEVLRNVGKELPELMKWADIGIFAAGSTIFEGLYLGLPLLCCLLATNQKINYVATGAVEDKYKKIISRLRSFMDFFLLKNIEVSCFDVKVIVEESRDSD